MFELEMGPESDPFLFSKILNVIRALQLTGIGMNPGKLENIRNNLNPILSDKEIIEILMLLVQRELAITEESSESYFITEQGRKLLVIGV